MNRLATYAISVSIALTAAGVALAADAPAKSVTGNLEDSYCYGTMGAKGASHKMCAIRCAAKGIPVALVEKGTDKIYVLLPNKDESPLPDDVTHRMEDEVTVTGKEYSKGGANFLVVESVK
ncbi:MAG: hypothetical protein Q7S58_10875 [Candidatus Binatus sp.]|uniref:hypothetical protein n=1 Tax=Candidatus Binatus sp. TaxID=2811406 RepID=UPI00272574CA|nr:hypothetical protein [Candidatus Binatus sp.]MDO8432898.1 hypothetical protein [Candidatus Binatus sp.]